jgi:hypothetical protein
VRLSCSHSLIFVSIHFSQSWISSIQLWLRCGVLSLRSGFTGNGLRGRIRGKMLWLRSDFARVMACEIEGMLALAAERFCKGLMACRGRSEVFLGGFTLAPGRHELDRNRGSKASRRIKFVSGYCSKNCGFDRNRGSKAGRRSNSLFKQLVARLVWY